MQLGRLLWGKNKITQAEFYYNDTTLSFSDKHGCGLAYVYNRKLNYYLHSDNEKVEEYS